MSPSPEPPEGPGWQLDKGGAYRRTIKRGEKLYYEYSDTKELIAIPGTSKPLSRTQSIPRYQPAQNIQTSHQSSVSRSSRTVALPNENAGVLESGQGHRLQRQESSYKEPQYEFKNRSEAPLRPQPAGSLVSRAQMAVGEHDPTESKAFKQASLDLLPDSLPRFLAIPAGDFTRCRNFIVSHPEVISISHAAIFELALQAQDSDEKASFLQCIQCLVLIDECNKKDPSRRNRYLTHLVDKDSESLRAFYVSCNEYTRQARQSQKNVATRQSRQPNKTESTLQGRQPHETESTSSVEERTTRPGTDQVDVNVPERRAGIPIPTSYSRITRQPLVETGRNANIKDSFPLSRSVNAGVSEQQAALTTSRTSIGQPAYQRRQSFVPATSDRPPPNANFSDLNRPNIPVSSLGYGPQDTTHVTSAYNTQSYHPSRLSHWTNPSRPTQPDDHTFSSYKPPTAYPAPLSHAHPADHQTPSFRQVVTSATGQPGTVGQQTFGLQSHEAENQEDESRGQIKRPPPSLQQPSRKQSNGPGQDPQIPRLNTVRDKGKIDYRGDVQRREFESHPEALDPEYEVQHSSFFVEGRVFLIPWPENFGVSRGASNNRSSDHRKGPIKGRYGEEIFSHPVRMVVVQEKPGGYSHCIRINSYGGQGTRSKNIPEGELLAHAVIHPSTKRAPEGEPWLTKDPIAVSMEGGETLSQSSRIHFGKIYTVEHNVKVKPVGQITQVSMPYFKSYFIRENFPQGSYP